MSGSTLRINVPEKSNRHDFLDKRNVPYQHILESIYRSSDGKNLTTILNELQATEKSVLFEKIIVENDGQREINLTAFQYNPIKDLLLVTIQGVEVYEGIEYDFIKTSPTKITFNYDLKKDYEVFILLAGTLSAESFGDEIYSPLTQFRQLVDVPNSYFGKGGKAVFVSQEENGLIFDVIRAQNSYVTFQTDYHLGYNQSVEGWINFLHMGTIKSIKVTPTDGYFGEFYLSIWALPNSSQNWLYYSGKIETILYDIMDIPFIDVSGNDAIYIKLQNKGPESNFNLKLFVLE